MYGCIVLQIKSIFEFYMGHNYGFRGYRLLYCISIVTYTPHPHPPPNETNLYLDFYFDLPVGSQLRLPI
jgi:hypothetical protein